jgi:DNA helicase-2/ATP-dependent DNA helicase PcrA
VPAGTQENLLEALNPKQRGAVGHGVGAVGAPSPHHRGGSGKTNTLAHRVAHLIIKGADPRRMLMTFSRRAATKMAQRITRRVLSDRARVMTDALTWAGTFRGVGARLLREYAERIGFEPAFRIDGLQNSANLLRRIGDLFAGHGKSRLRIATSNIAYLGKFLARNSNVLAFARSALVFS